MKIKKIILITLLASIALSGSVAALQENATTTSPTTSRTNTTTTDSASSSSTPTNDTARYLAAETLSGDDSVHLVNYWEANGSMHIQLYAESSALVALSAPPDSRADVAGGYVEREGIKPNQLKTITIPSPGGIVWVSTATSTRNGRFTRVKTGGTTILGGPYDGNDVRDAGLGGALGVSIAILYEAVKAKNGKAHSPEQMA